MLRIPTELPDDLETLIDQQSAAASLFIELSDPDCWRPSTRGRCVSSWRRRRLSSKRRSHFDRVRGQLLCHQRLDFVVAAQLVLEIKSVDHLDPVHRAQLLSYLRGSKLRAGLLINFNVPVLQDGVKRVVL